MENLCFIFELEEERGNISREIKWKECLSNKGIPVQDEVCGRRGNA